MKRSARQQVSEWHALQVVSGAIPNPDDHLGALQHWTESPWMQRVAVWVLSGRDVFCREVPTCPCGGCTPNCPPNLPCSRVWRKSAAELPAPAHGTNQTTSLLTASCIRLGVGPSTERQIIALSTEQLGQNAAIPVPFNGRKVAFVKMVGEDFEVSTGFESVTQLENLRDEAFA